jgi:hypothetical protein
MLLLFVVGLFVFPSVAILLIALRSGQEAAPVRARRDHPER